MNEINEGEANKIKVINVSKTDDDYLYESQNTPVKRDSSKIDRNSILKIKSYYPLWKMRLK
jgi:hypothetical protein